MGMGACPIRVYVCIDVKQKIVAKQMHSVVLIDQTTPIIRRI